VDLQVVGFQLRQCEIGAGVLSGAMHNAVLITAGRTRLVVDIEQALGWF
jgi:hypothetical protein